MIITNVTLHHIRLPLKHPFATSYGTYTDRDVILVEVQTTDGISGWGECVAFATPWYTEETIVTAWHVLTDFLIPALLNTQIDHPNDIPQLFKHIKRHYMAKAGLEMAVWDAYARTNNLSLSQAIGGTRQHIEAGVAIGLQENEADLFHLIEGYIAEQYKRFKVKIKPNTDITLIRSIRERFPSLPLMADANSAYTLRDIEHLKQLDDYDLMMIEQPLADDDIFDHAKLQRQIKTPVCLDESINSYADARQAIEGGSCQIINIKIGRVGGITEAIRIHDLCVAANTPVWCGGMLETGIGRAHNIALASLSGFTIPGDISASSRYWHRDIIEPEIEVQNGKITVPQKPGIGVQIDHNFLKAVTMRRQLYNMT